MVIFLSSASLKEFESDLKAMLKVNPDSSGLTLIDCLFLQNYFFLCCEIPFSFIIFG